MTTGDSISVVLATATVVLAYATWRMASASKATVQEIKHDRELAHEPVLSVVVGPFQIGKHPAGVAVDPGTGAVYVANYNAHTVTVVNKV